MGQENSAIDDSTPPETLSERSLAAVADYIKSGQARRIVVMTGAGISTAAGIPDFRSPETGLYANLSRLNLPYAEAVFDISYFRKHPEPFYVLAKELYPGKYHPTVSHVFIALLAEKGLLLHLFTQNIDCLERRAGVPDDLVVEAHGSFATQRCIECGTEYPDDWMKEHVEKGEVPHCATKECDGLVKPDIVFFGEALPQLFRDRQSYPAMADLALVMGTSLTVQPFSSLPSVVRSETPRVLFNLEQVGGMGTRADDVLCLGDCDAGIRKLADELGWRDELEAKWRSVVGTKEAERQLSVSERTRAPVEQEDLDQLVDRVGEALHIDDNGPEDGEATAGAKDSNAEQAADKPSGTVAPADGKDEPATAAVPKEIETKPEDKTAHAGKDAKEEVAAPQPPGEASKTQEKPSSTEAPVGKPAL